MVDSWAPENSLENFGQILLEALGDIPGGQAAIRRHLLLSAAWHFHRCLAEELARPKAQARPVLPAVALPPLPFLQFYFSFVKVCLTERT